MNNGKHSIYGLSILSFFFYFTRKMSKLFISIVGILVLLSFSAISGENDKLSKDVTDILHDIFGEYVPQIGVDDEIAGLQFYGAAKQSSNHETGEDTVPLGKNVEKPNEKRQTIDWSRSQTGVKNAGIAGSCCTGMWGRSLRNTKNGSFRKSSVNGLESPKSDKEIASSAGLTTISGPPSENRRKKPVRMLRKSLQPNNPSQYRKFSSKKLN